MAVIGKNFAYLAIPRTASRAITKWLEEHCGGVAKRYTDGAEDVTSQHARIPAEACSDKIVFTCVRHPFQRLVSCWRHCYGDRQPFVEYLERLEALRKNYYAYSDHFSWRSQSLFADLHPGIRIIKFEDLPDCLATLPFVNGAVQDFPQEFKGENAAHTKDWRRHYGRRELELALAHSGDDFERFGYPIL